MIGKTISHYKILKKLGEGGMGEVYLAEDTELDRKVALKFLPPQYTSDPEFNKRFRREAKAAAALNHPNIVTVHEIGEFEGRAYIVMEYVEGESLREKIGSAGAGLTISHVVDIVTQICDGINAAHQAGITHRDIKPENIIVDKSRRVRILDFGLARMAGMSKLTKEGSTLGTVFYMSPEQLRSEPVDQRADIWAVGVVLYEMLTGVLPFRGEYVEAVIYSVLNEEPTPMQELRPEIPAELQTIVERTLDKKIDSRLSSITALSEQLLQLKRDFQPADSREFNAIPLMTRIKNPWIAVPTVLIVAAIVFFAIQFFSKRYKVRWARYEAPELVEGLLREIKYTEAFLVAQKAQAYLPDDPKVKKMVETTSLPCAVQTEPPGAEIYFKDYAAVDADWQYLGRTPLDSTRLPSRYLRIRVTKPGYETVENAINMFFVKTLRFTLTKSETAPLGMALVPAGMQQLGSDEAVKITTYWLDKYEVTNKQYKEFMDAGCYHKPEYWKHPFVKDGDALTFEQAMGFFQDATGQPGPSTWELGTYPEGTEDYPVSGVSWYEAAAYAEFAGKSLPTVYHWRRAAGFGAYHDILTFSNFDNQGPAATGAYDGLSGYGCYDMAGNVKEWCLNETTGKRYILGGGWNEPEYMYHGKDTAVPFAREGTYGFRCAKYTEPLSERLIQPIDALYHDFNLEKPVTDEIFAIYKGLYSYDRLDLDARVDSVDETSAYWRKETVSFNAAYGGERVIAHLFLPKNAKPPYQVVIYYPGGGAFSLTSSQNLAELAVVDFIPRSGRAFVYPVVKGTYERGGGQWPGGPRTRRDWRIMQGKDVQRSVDYLETRDDIDSERIAYFGLSAGAAEGPIFTAIETRFKASILLAGGLGYWRMRREPEINPLNFASHVKVPTLMINGRYDSGFPLETSSGPLFRLLGTQEQDKRHALFDSGHFPAHNDIIRETLNWLDRYLGNVKK